MQQDELFMKRCLDLARLGAGKVAPNPMVGAVLVHEGKIIGEGYHKEYGKAHAEVHCLASVSETDRPLIPESSLYVSLEPCAHFGKTPPCSDLIIEEKLPRVVIGCRDPFEKVNGRGVEILEAAGVEVVENILEEECRELNKRFFLFHTEHRPYIILKWAQTSDNRMGFLHTERLYISNEFSNRIVHKWRGEEMAILVGTNTTLMDDPALTTRLWSGHNPTRLVVDKELKLPRSLRVFDKEARTIVFNLHKHGEEDNLLYYQVTEDVNLVHQVTNALYQLQINSVIVEGGALLLQSFIDEGLWDEARMITNENLSIGEGVQAPVLEHHSLVHTEHIFGDRISIFHHEKHKA